MFNRKENLSSDKAGMNTMETLGIHPYGKRPPETLVVVERERERERERDVNNHYPAK